MKAKLLVVTSTFPRWRNDTDPPFVYELSKRLTSDFEVTVHTPHYHGSLPNEMMDGMQIHRFRYFFSYFERLAGGQGMVPKLRRNKLYYLLLPFFLSSQFASLLLLVFVVKPHVIHAHWLIPQGLLAVMIKRIFGVPVVVTAHGADVYSLRQKFFVSVKKYIVNNVDRVVAVSKPLARVLVDDTQIIFELDVIPMGVDSKLFVPQFRNLEIRKQYNIQDLFLLFVGRLTEKKGIRYLIDSMPLVIAEIPHAKLLVIGSGELEEELKKRVENLDLKGAICFAGGIDNKNLPKYYATADIFIGPSISTADGDSEGFGLTFVEAAMSGCLLIGTKTGGIEDIISDGETGYLVQPEDGNALAKIISFSSQYLSDHNEMRNKSRKYCIEKFEWSVICMQYSNLFKREIERNKQV